MDSTRIGIDPGGSGSIAIISPRGVKVMPIPWEDKVLQWEKVYKLFKSPPKAVYIEQVQGRGGWAAQANFSFGSSYGQLLMAIKLSRWNMVMVRPQAWQKLIHAGIKAKTAKEKTRLAYARFCPDDILPRNRNNILNHNDMDALMIGIYGLHEEKLCKEKHHYSSLSLCCCSS